VGAAVTRARHALDGLPALFGEDGSRINWLFVGRGAAFQTQPNGSIRAVTLPADAPRANMSYTFGGERLAMVVLPLSSDVDANARLLVHEAMHTLQPERLPHPGRTEPMDGGDLLDRADGRTWLFLELRALARALIADGAARTSIAHDALAFRAYRESLAHPTERARLDALDLAEGLPEYAGWRLVGSPIETLAPRLERAQERRVSWVRAVGYSTGPAYGYLLDQVGRPGWRERWKGGARLPDLLRESLGPDPSTLAVTERALRYDGAPLIAAERARDAERTRILDSLRTRFVHGRVLRLVPGEMRVTFDPNGQVPLDNAGTVMQNFRWAGADGAELSAVNGALVSPSWAYAQVPLGTRTVTEGTLREALRIDGDGWTLRLPAGWQITTVGNVVELRPPAPSPSPGALPQ